MNPIRAIMWDVGGTLVDLAAPGDLLRERALADCGLDPRLLDVERVERALRDFMEDELRWRSDADERAGWLRHATLLLEGSDATSGKVRRLGERLAAYFDIYKPVQGMIELLEQLRAAGVRQAVVSNWAPSLCAFLAHHRLSRFFECVICSATLGRSKPEPAIFEEGLRQLRLSPQHVLFIGNDPTLDIQAARAVGMRTIHFDPRREHSAAEASDVPALQALLVNYLNTP